MHEETQSASGGYSRGRVSRQWKYASFLFNRQVFGWGGLLREMQLMWMAHRSNWSGCSARPPDRASWANAVMGSQARHWQRQGDRRATTGPNIYRSLQSPFFGPSQPFPLPSFAAPAVQGVVVSGVCRTYTTSNRTAKPRTTSHARQPPPRVPATANLVEAARRQTPPPHSGSPNLSSIGDACVRAETWLPNWSGCRKVVPQRNRGRKGPRARGLLGHSSS